MKQDFEWIPLSDMCDNVANSRLTNKILVLCKNGDVFVRALIEVASYKKSCDVTHFAFIPDVPTIDNRMEAIDKRSALVDTMELMQKRIDKLQERDTEIVRHVNRMECDIQNAFKLITRLANSW